MYKKILKRAYFLITLAIFKEKFSREFEKKGKCNIVARHTIQI